VNTDRKEASSTAAAEGRRRIEQVIEGRSRPSLRWAVRELWRFRGTILAFAERDVRVKYKHAVLGVGWAILQPLAYLAVFAVFFGKVAGLTGNGIPYAAFALSALIPWTYVATSVSFGANALLGDAALVRKIYFPREVPVLAAALASTLDFAAGLVVFLILGSFLGANLSWTLILAPLLLPLLALPVLGLSLALAALNVYYRDFRYALPLGIQLWMFASPVAYPLTSLPEAWHLPYALANPVVGPLEGFRCVLSLGTLPPAELLGISALGGLLWVCLGYLVFKAMEPNIADMV
jgi:ABC-type polysaccharide/polyol phosphate export permease